MTVSPNDDQISADMPYPSQFVEVLGSRMHYVEAGSGDSVLFLHGNPTSSYLWRNVMSYLVPDARCIAVDLIGMGQSDKPDIEYRLADHVRYVDAFIETLGLARVTLVIHDWGSALGFHYARRHETNVKGVAFMEAVVRPLAWDEWPGSVRALFKQFRTPEVGWDLIVNQHMFVERVLPGAIQRDLTPAEMDTYRAPYLDPPTRKPLWRWPNEIPLEGEPAGVVEVVQAYTDWLQGSSVPKLLLYATPGAILRADMVAWCQAHIKALTSVNIGPGLHFVQEDQPHAIGRALRDWYRTL
jgi:haloalkane dehalogenase